jgi:hypothetical protein
MPRILVPNPLISGLLALHWFLPVIFLHMPYILGTIFDLSPKFSFVVLRKILQVFYGDDRKSTSSGCFNILVVLNLSP